MRARPVSAPHGLRVQAPHGEPGITPVQSDTLTKRYAASVVRLQGNEIRKEVCRPCFETHGPHPCAHDRSDRQMDKQRKSGLQSKIAETEAMVARLNIQLKNIETEARQVEAVRKSLERNVNGKVGLSAVNAQCLDIKSRKVRVRSPGSLSSLSRL